MDQHFTSVTKTVTNASIPWWFVMIAGITMFIMGMLFLISPAMTLLVLAQIAGLYWLVTGILSLVDLCIDKTLWGWKLFSGILGVIAGLVVLRDPLWSAIFVPTLLVLFLAIESLLMGVSQMIH
ncbi:MAG: DUF308 domain-containing protein, partial [Ktedonobacteraceae bacterium]|nr:DUF308 domain-containing protein [Ktedonobacteraceae bacterium]